MSRRAIILAGGKGKRLRPYTVVLPKPLMPIGEYPILEVIVRQLHKCGFDHITMALNHQANIIKSFFGNGEKWGITIDYSLETQPLSTMGPLQLIDNLPNNFLVMNGDILSDIDYGKLFSEHEKSRSIFTISSFSRDEYIDYGVLEENGGVLTGFREKPHYSFEVSMGVYVANKKILEYIPKNQAYGFDELMLNMIAQKQKVLVKNYEGIWLDIGRPDDYEKAIDLFETQKKVFLNE